MRKHKKLPDPTAPDQDNPAWTREDFRTAMSFDQLPKTLQKKLRGRPKSATPKEHIAIRLSEDVLRKFRATGAGWQTRIDGALKDWLKHNNPG